MAIHDDPATDNVLGESTNLQLVRLRLFLALVTMFAIPIVITAPMVYGLAWGFGASLVLPTLALLALAGILGSLTVWLSRRVLEPAERLEGARRILEDAYDRARSEALRDTLTGLGNHRAFQEEMERQWAGAVRHNQPLALAIVDLDDFKRINDARGHAVGDVLLRHAATTMAGYLRRSDRAFRIGGDEFAIIMPGTDSNAGQLAVRRVLAGCLDGEGDAANPSGVSFSAGISAIPGQARDRDSLYRQADAALFWSKRHGRTCVTIYDPERHDGPLASRPPAELSALVARVAATGALRAVFQPIYDLSTGVPRGFEGLIRPLPDSGFADPSSMFEAAEATGRTAELDIACLNTVMETAARLRLPGSLTVNMSPRTLEIDDFSIHALHPDDRPPRARSAPHRARADRTRRGRGRRARPSRGGRLPRRGHPPGGRRHRCRQRRAAAAEPAQVRHRQDRPLAGPGRGGPRRLAGGRFGPCATWPIAGARWWSPRGSRRPPSSTSSARWASVPARAISSADRRIGRRPSRSISKDSAAAPTG